MANLIKSLVKDELVPWASKAEQEVDTHRQRGNLPCNVHMCSLVLQVVQTLSRYQVDVQESINELLYTERVYLQHLNQMKYVRDVTV